MDDVPQLSEPPLPELKATEHAGAVKVLNYLLGYSEWLAEHNDGDVRCSAEITDWIESLQSRLIDSHPARAAMAADPTAGAIGGAAAAVPEKKLLPVCAGARVSIREPDGLRSVFIRLTDSLPHAISTAVRKLELDASFR
jgi:hypothetical protein